MDYQKLSKTDLLEEVKKRRAAGSKISTEKGADEAALIAALKKDDSARVNAIESQIPLAPDVIENPTQPSDEEFAGGFKARNKGDGYVYQVIKQEVGDRPYKARIPKQSSGHPGMYWEGSPEEFSDCFERV
jgi:uncharacterized protein (UPF0305 family)